MGKLSKRSRKRSIPPLNTSAGKASVEHTRHWVEATWGLPADPMDLPDCLLWTALLPGYEQARVSAAHAFGTVVSELTLLRRLSAAEDIQQRAEIIAVEKLRFGFSPVEVFATLARFVPPEALSGVEQNILRKGSQLVRDAGRPGKNSVFYDTAYRMRLEGDPWATDEVAALATMAFGRTTSLSRYFFPMLWMSMGFWLAEVPDIVAWFTTRQKRIPLWSTYSVPEPNTIRAWTSELGLVRRRGKGLVKYDQNGCPRIDKTLRKSLLLAACREHPESDADPEIIMSLYRC